MRHVDLRRWAVIALGCCVLAAMTACSGGGSEAGDCQDEQGAARERCEERIAVRAEAMGLGAVAPQPAGETGGESTADGAVGDGGMPAPAEASPPLETDEIEAPEPPREEHRSPGGAADRGHGAPASPSGPDPCASVPDVSVAVSSGSSLDGDALACVRYLALEHDPLEVEDFTRMQVAAVGLYNVRDAQWSTGVERALSYSELRNSPNLNFAGLKPAYDRGSYGAVIARANVVWNNLDKGYRLSDDDCTFVAEFACRAGVQRHMAGTTSADHDRWCRIWADRLEREGKDATVAQELLQQVE